MQRLAVLGGMQADLQEGVRSAQAEQARLGEAKQAMQRSLLDVMGERWQAAAAPLHAHSARLTSTLTRADGLAQEMISKTTSSMHDLLALGCECESRLSRLTAGLLI